MYVIPEHKYKLLMNNSIQSPITAIATPPTLAHSPVTNDQSPFTKYRCNICKTIFKNKQRLKTHLAAHKPQTGPGADKPTARTEFPTEFRFAPPELRCKICNKDMKHKRNLLRHMKVHKNSIQLNATKWETLS